MATAPKITTFLWFDDNAEEAIAYYQSIFGGGSITDVIRNGEAGPGAPGSLLAATFTLAGQDFVAMNGGPGHPFTDAISLVVDCATQDEVDDYWNKLSAGGTPVACGWLKDRFGVSWQVTPRRLIELMADADPSRASRTMQAMMKMVKIDIAALERAADGH